MLSRTIRCSVIPPNEWLASKPAPNDRSGVVMSEVLKFVFKGSRNYVQGTSLFNALVEAAIQRGFAEGKISISFKHMIHNVVCILEERAPTPADAVVAKITGFGGDSCELCINPTT